MKIQNDDYTHRAETILPSGASLEILRCETGYLLRGSKGEYKAEIALTHQAITFLTKVVSGEVPMEDLTNVDVEATGGLKRS